MPSLRALSMMDNRITQLPQSFADMMEIPHMHADFRNNPIAQLPECCKRWSPTKLHACFGV
jgi:hypothetical protein